jgi:hypothetical protein
MSQRLIRPDAKLVQEIEYTRQKEALPIGKPVVQYVRQSSMGQVKRNTKSVIQQDQKLGEKLLKMGFIDIVKIDEDQGKSGQKSQEKRRGLNRLYGMMERGEMGAVAAFDASRLHRDLTRMYYTEFVHKCEEYGIVVITMETEYYPSSRNDMDMLMDKFKEAAHQLDQVYLKANPARMIAIEESLSYGGHAIPMGFLVVGEKGERRYYTVYEPHAEIVRWLFRRYRELGGSIPRLGREVRTMGLAFPAFQGVAEKPHVALRFDGDGYPIKTRDALASILSNPAYIGWYIFNGVIISKEAHPAIVEMDDFLFAYNRLSKYVLGSDEVNTEKPIVDRRYGVDVPALLEGILESDGNPVYVMARRKAYEAVVSTDNWVETTLVVRVDLLDRAFHSVLWDVLSALEIRKRDGAVDSLYEQLVVLQGEKAAESMDVQKQLANIDKAIRGWELDKQSAREQGYKPGLDEANRQLKRLHADREALETRMQRAEREKTELEKTKSLLAVAAQQWEKWPFEQKRRFVRLLVASANIREVSPHIVRLDVQLKPPLGQMLVGHIYRTHGSRGAWTPEEEEILRRLYPQSDRKDVVLALPRRSWRNCLFHAMVLKLQRTTHLNTSEIDENVSYEDALLMEELGMERGSVVWNVGDLGVPVQKDIDCCINQGGKSTVTR